MQATELLADRALLDPHPVEGLLFACSASGRPPLDPVGGDAA
jgi:hypothetical protein